MNKTTNKDGFFSLLNKAIMTPADQVGDKKSVSRRSASYNGKKTRINKKASTSGKRRGTSR